MAKQHLSAAPPTPVRSLPPSLPTPTAQPQPQSHKSHQSVPTPNSFVCHGAILTFGGIRRRRGDENTDID